MLSKLLKYDLKYMFKNMSIFYFLAIFFSVLTRILFSLKQTVFINIIGKISVGCMFSMVGSILFNTVIRSWVRFRDSIYKDESYLTHTLPVTKKQIYESRFLQALIFTFVGFVFIIISLFITYYTHDRWLLLSDTLNSISSEFNLNTWYIVFCLIFILFLEIFNMLQSGFLGLILGYKMDNQKITYSFVFGFVSYLLSQFIMVLCVLLVGIFNTDIMSIFKNTVLIDTSIIKSLCILSSILYLLIIIVMNIICCKELGKGVNVE